MKMARRYSLRSEIDQEFGKISLSKEYYVAMHVRSVKATYKVNSLKYFGNIVPANNGKQKAGRSRHTVLQDKN